jgi:hypothetical protein
VVTLEEVKKVAEEYMAKEVEMLYKITLLSKDDATSLKEWYTTHPYSQKLQGYSGFLTKKMEENSSS